MGRFVVFFGDLSVVDTPVLKPHRKRRCQFRICGLTALQFVGYQLSLLALLLFTTAHKLCLSSSLSITVSTYHFCNISKNQLLLHLSSLFSTLRIT